MISSCSETLTVGAPQGKEPDKTTQRFHFKVIVIYQPSVNFDMNFIAFDFNVELLDFGDRDIGRRARVTAKHPAVPGALDGPLGFINPPFAERPAAMRAGVIDGVDFSVDVKEGDLIAADCNTHTFTRCEVREVRYFYKHAVKLPKIRCRPQSLSGVREN